MKLFQSNLHYSLVLPFYIAISTVLLYKMPTRKILIKLYLIKFDYLQVINKLINILTIINENNHFKIMVVLCCFDTHFNFFIKSNARITITSFLIYDQKRHFKTNIHKLALIMRIIKKLVFNNIFTCFYGG